MGRLVTVTQSAYRPVLGVQDKKKLSNYKKKAKNLKAIRGRSLSHSERNELAWLVRARECIMAGLLTVNQAKGLESYRKLSPTAQFQQLDQNHMEVRRNLGLLHGRISDDDDGYGKAQNLLNDSSAFEARQAQPMRLFQQAASLPSPNPGAVTAFIYSLMRLSPDAGTNPQPTPFQHSGRSWVVKNATKSRILSVKEHLSQFFWKASPSRRNSFHGRTEHLDRLSKFFTRRDNLFFNMSPDPLQFYRPPPMIHQDLFDAATRVVRVENIIGYRFQNKKLCIEALKGSMVDIPLYWQGVITPIANNRRLALLGDRVLALGMTALWWDAKLPTSAYGTAMAKLESRASLGLRATLLGIDDTLIIRNGANPVPRHLIAETLEAIIGAVYVDSNNSLSVVQGVLKKLRFEKDLHQLAEAMKPSLEHAAVSTTSTADPTVRSVTASAIDPATKSMTASIVDSTPDTSTHPIPRSAIELSVTLAPESATLPTLINHDYSREILDDIQCKKHERKEKIEREELILEKPEEKRL
ncbi:hypothetical protein DPSP01_010142 [Paraphaeosphaeria sporulosa]